MGEVQKHKAKEVLNFMKATTSLTYYKIKTILTLYQVISDYHNDVGSGCLPNRLLLSFLSKNVTRVYNDENEAKTTNNKRKKCLPSAQCQ